MIEKIDYLKNEQILQGVGCCGICGLPFEVGDTVYAVDDYENFGCCQKHAKQLEM